MKETLETATTNTEGARGMAVDVVIETAEEEQNPRSMTGEPSETKDKEIFPLDSGWLVRAAEQKEPTETELREIHCHLQSIHSGSEHCFNEALAGAMRKRGARPEGIKKVEIFRCLSREEDMVGDHSTL